MLKQIVPTLVVGLLLCFPPLHGNAQTIAVPALADKFTQLYQQRWGDAQPCDSNSTLRFAVCGTVLRNEGNAPFILFQPSISTKVAVLVHGLSDSPFYLSAIADLFHQQGYTVIVPLLPGHGQQQADKDMQDAQLGHRWQRHVADLLSLVREEQVSIVVGGFSTGGALVVDHYLSHPDKIEGIALFSGALALSENAETLSRIWGIKWVAKLLDGDYNTEGSNPFKYPQVSSFAALQLMDIIRGIRQKISDGRRIQVPLFAAHSDADTTTPSSGIEALVSVADNSNMVIMYGQDEQICHADVVVSETMYQTLASQPGWQDSAERCASSRANPKFDKLLRLLQSFLIQLPPRD